MSSKIFKLEWDDKKIGNVGAFNVEIGLEREYRTNFGFKVTEIHPIECPSCGAWKGLDKVETVEHKREHPNPIIYGGKPQPPEMAKGFNEAKDLIHPEYPTLTVIKPQPTECECGEGLKQWQSQPPEVPERLDISLFHGKNRKRVVKKINELVDYIKDLEDKAYGK